MVLMLKNLLCLLLVAFPNTISCSGEGVQGHRKGYDTFDYCLTHVAEDTFNAMTRGGMLAGFLERHNRK